METKRSTFKIHDASLTSNFPLFSGKPDKKKKLKRSQTYLQTREMLSRPMNNNITHQCSDKHNRKSVRKPVAPAVEALVMPSGVSVDKNRSPSEKWRRIMFGNRNFRHARQHSRTTSVGDQDDALENRKIYHALVCVDRLHVKPLVRFRRAVKTVQVLLKATRSTNRNTHKRNDAKLLSLAHDDFSTSRRTYEMFGLSFDPSDYKANREVLLSSEAKVVLSLEPKERSDDQLKLALLALNQAVDAFGEFPITMQRSLVRVGWYECFEDKRVIIRQGHRADNFYFILSGTAVVTIMETDSQNNSEIIITAAVLKKGNSFGELALMHGAKRSATVTCKDSVELLAVGRDDFIDIFMPVDKDQEPEHIQFLRTTDLMKGWPIHKLPYHDPKICCYTYFRRGLLLCKDSNTSDWVYIIKSGSCRILKALSSTKPNIPGLSASKSCPGTPGAARTSEKMGHHTKLPPISSAKSSNTSYCSSSDSSVTSCRDYRHNAHRKPKRYSSEALANILSQSAKEERISTADHKRRIERLFNMKHKEQDKTQKKRRETIKPLIEDDNGLAADAFSPDTVFVQIQKLGPRETYGIEQVAFGRIGQTTSTMLVSDGAECVLINRKFFKQYLSDEVAKRIRRTLQPIPSENSLQQKLQNKTNWEAYKAMTVVNHLLYRKHVHDVHPPSI